MATGDVNVGARSSCLQLRPGGVVMNTAVYVSNPPPPITREADGNANCRLRAGRVATGENLWDFKWYQSIGTAGSVGSSHLTTSVARSRTRKPGKQSLPAAVLSSMAEE